MTESKKRVPRRRFKEFVNANEWEQCKLIDILCQSISDGPHETPDLVEKGIPFISVDAIVDNKIDFSRARGFITEKYHLECCRKYKPELHDVYLVKSGSTVGKVAIVETVQQFNIWSPLAAMRCNEDNNPYFLYHLLQTDNMQNQVFDKCSHGTQPNLSMRQLEKFDICVPSVIEQCKIKDIFNSIDNLITLHQRKLNKLISIKKAYLNEMFPAKGERKPRRRFKGFTDDWEQRKLEDIAEIIGGGTPSTSNMEYWDGNIDWYAPAEIDNQIYASGSVRKITEQGLKNSSAKILPANKTILFTSRAGIGKTAILSHPGATNQGFQSFVLKDGFNPYFVYSMSNQIKEKAEAVASGSTFLEISGKMLGKLEIMVPDKTEQDEIGAFFNELDNLITLHQQKLTKLKNLKKAYLNEMFI